MVVQENKHQNFVSEKCYLQCLSKLKDRLSCMKFLHEILRKKNKLPECHMCSCHSHNMHRRLLSLMFLLNLHLCTLKWLEKKKNISIWVKDHNTHNTHNTTRTTSNNRYNIQHAQHTQHTTHRICTTRTARTYTTDTTRTTCATHTIQQIQQIQQAQHAQQHTTGNTVC